MDHSPATCTTDFCEECLQATNCGHADAVNETHDGFLLCAECFADYTLDQNAAAESAFGYTPGEDRCPVAERILANEAFLPYREVQALLHAHGHCHSSPIYTPPTDDASNLQLD